MIVAAGIDSWSPCWYLPAESSAGRRLSELATVGVRRGFVLPEKVAGYTVGWNRSAGQLYVEGRGDRDGLLCPDDLPIELDRVVDALSEADIPVPHMRRELAWDGSRAPYGFGGIRRCDSTCDVRLGSTGEGLAVLAGVAAIARVAGRVKGEVVWGVGGEVETVYWRGYGGRKVLGRWYDKGIERGAAARGVWIRPEDQRRYPLGHRRAPEEMTGAYVREAFQRRFVDLWRASGGVKVAGRSKVTRELVGLAQDGEIRAQQAVRLIGWAHAKAEGLQLPRETRRRHESELRALGLVVADGSLEEVEIDLGEVLDAVMDDGCWGASG